MHCIPCMPCLICVSLRDGVSVNFTKRLDRCQPLDCVRVTLDQIDKKRCLGIWLCATLLPVLQCADVGPQINRKEGTRDLQSFSHANKFLRSHIRRRLELHSMSSHRSLPVSRVSQRFHSFPHFRQKTTQRTPLRLA